jgi:hypothetical protein
LPNLSLGNKQPTAEEIAAGNTQQCQTRAKSRLSLFDRPDTYPISAEEKNNAYQALYNECMKEFDVQVANTPKPHFETVAANTDANLANLSPAAGGASSAQEQKSPITYSNGMMIIDTSQLGKSNPAAGTAVTTGANGSTVVVVQAPPSTTSITYPPAPTGPAAIPVEGKMIQPATNATAKPAVAPNPKNLITETEKPAPVEKPKKHAKKAASTETAAPAATTSEKRSVIFEPSRFQKNAEPLSVDLKTKQENLNGLSPAAGNLLENAINTNRPAPKD